MATFGHRKDVPEILKRYSYVVGNIKVDWRPRNILNDAELLGKTTCREMI